MTNSKKIDVFVLCLLVSGGLISLRFVTNYPREVIQIVWSFLQMFEAVITAFGVGDIVHNILAMPSVYIITITVGVTVLINSLIVMIFKKTTQQISVMVSKNLTRVIVSGMVLYGLFLAAIFLFAYSVVGIPIAFGMGVFLFVMTKIGSIPINIYIGEIVTQRLNVMELTTVKNLWLGSFVTFLTNIVYSFGVGFMFFIYPVLALGSVFTYVVNVLVLKIRYKKEDRHDIEKSDFDRQKIRDIIYNGN